MPVRLILIVLLGTLPATDLHAQRFFRRAAACRCEPSGKTRKPKFLLPVAGIGFLPVSLAVRDSQPPMVAMPSIVDIRADDTRNALEGERALEVGALAPDTATTLPTLMVVASLLTLAGVYLLIPHRRRRRRAWRSRSGQPGHGVWRLRSVHKRRAGTTLALGGGLLLVLGSREYAEGAQAQRKARAEWLREFETPSVASGTEEPVRTPRRMSEIDTSTAPAVLQPTVPDGASAVPLPLFAMSGREIRRGTPVARLTIESIGLDEIVLEGVGPVELNGGPGHFPGSVLPGGTGNSILSAHRDRHFRRVGELAVGAKLRTETRRKVVEWVVTERRIVSKDTPSLFEESEETLTLTTCWPLRYFGPAPDRLLIIAKPAT